MYFVHFTTVSIVTFIPINRNSIPYLHDVPLPLLKIKFSLNPLNCTNPLQSLVTFLAEYKQQEPLLQGKSEGLCELQGWKQQEASHPLCIHEAKER